MTLEDVERLVDAHDEIVKELGTFLHDGPARQETKRQADKTKDALMSAIRSVFAERDTCRAACVITKELVDDRAALQARVNRYGWHDDDCDAVRPSGELRKPLIPCSCGFSDPIAQEQGKQP